MTEPTNAELMVKVEGLVVEMRGGFTGVNARLDKVNGQLDKHAATLGTHAVRLGEQGVHISKLEESVEKVQGDAKQAATSLQSKLAGIYRSIHSLRPGTPVDEEKRAVTRRDVAIVSATVGATLGLFELLPRILARVHLP